MYSYRASKYGRVALTAPPRATPQVPCGALPCACPSGDVCVPLSSYLDSQLGAALPLALTAALATVVWPQSLSFSLGVISPGGAINVTPLIQTLELGTAGGGTFVDLSACAAQLQVTATIILPSVTMTLATPATLSMALTGTLTAWVATMGGETVLTALTATNLGLAPNPFAGGQVIVAPADSLAASASLAGLLTPLLASGLATTLADQVLSAVLPLPISLGPFALCAPAATREIRPLTALARGLTKPLAWPEPRAWPRRTPEPEPEPKPKRTPEPRRAAVTAPVTAPATRRLGLVEPPSAVASRRPFHTLSAPLVGDSSALLTALAMYLQSQLNGGLWSTIATSVGFTLGGNPSKIDPLNLSGVVSGYSGASSCGSTCIDGTSSYGRGAGSCSCPGGYDDMGLYCYKWWPPDSQQCGGCGPGEESWGGGPLCYPTCQAGYSPAGCCICSQQVQMCAGGVGGFQLGNLTGLAGLTFSTFTVSTSPDMNVLAATATVSGTVSLSGGSAWGSAAVFEVPCGDGDNWQSYIPHEVSVSLPSVPVGMTAQVAITIPWVVAPTSDPDAPPSPYPPPYPLPPTPPSTMLMFESASVAIQGIAVDPWDWASALASVPGLSSLADSINGQVSSVLNGAVASAVPKTLLASLGDVILPFAMQ